MRKFDGTLSEFIRDVRYGITKILALCNPGTRCATSPATGCFVLHGEDIHADPHKVLAWALAFVEACNVDDQVVRNAVEYSVFGWMREMERANRWTNDAMRPGCGDDEESYKARRGVVGGYRGYLSEEACST